MVPMKCPRLLCVDDDGGIRDLYEVLLSSFGYEVIAAEDGPRALQLFHGQRDRIDAVILDYQMPEMNGVELAAELKRLRGDLPIIMISGSQPLIEENCAVVDASMPKGIEIEKLVTKLEMLLADRRGCSRPEPRAGSSIAVPF
jgi:CheY-like chemotaxis protein